MTEEQSLLDALAASIDRARAAWAEERAAAGGPGSGSGLEPGLYPALPDADHHADPALGSTDLKNLLRSPARFRHERDQPVKASPAMDLGSVVHALVLGTGASYTVSPYTEYRTTEAKQWRHQQQAAGVVVVKQQEHDLAEAMADAVFDHEIAGHLIDTASLIEATAVADIPTTTGTPVRCKARYDALLPEAGIDLKTTADPDLEPWALTTTLKRYAYHVQGGAYAQVMHEIGEPPRDHLLVWVSSVPPHFVAVRRLTQRALDLGRRRAAAAREIYARCTATGQWPGPAGFADLDLPEWAYTTTDHLTDLDTLDLLEDPS